jgi:predicted TIM-barrel fold metal-dependent hydrolase
MIFEGVFDRFPKTKVVLTELGWSWAAPFAGRLDASWRVLRDEVADLERKPSEYMRDHFWFTTQPMEEPEQPEWFEGVYAQFERVGFGGKLMYSSDYPHWDFDSPDDALPAWLPEDLRRRILAGNAHELYGIPTNDQDGSRLDSH